VYAATPEVGTPLAGGASGASTPVLVATLKPAASAPALPLPPSATATARTGRAGGGGGGIAAGSRSPLTVAAQAPALLPPPSPSVTATTTSRPGSPAASPRLGGKPLGGSAAALITSSPCFDADGELPGADGASSGGAGTTPLAFMPLV
jgi:hypothetical protein